MTLKDRLSIELQQDLRRGAIRYGNDYYHAKVRKVAMTLKDRLSIELQQDLRRGAIRYGNDYIMPRYVKFLYDTKGQIEYRVTARLEERGHQIRQ